MLQKLIRVNIPSSFDKRQTHQTKAASSSDKITVDFVVNDPNRKDLLMQEKYKRQRKEHERFKKEVEQMRAAKQLKVLQDSYRRRGIVI